MSSSEQAQRPQLLQTYHPFEGSVRKSKKKQKQKKQKEQKSKTVVKKINKAVLPDADESESSVDVNLTVSGSLSNLVSDLVAEPMCPRICASLCSRKIARKFQAPVGWCVGEVTN